MHTHTYVTHAHTYTHIRHTCTHTHVTHVNTGQGILALNSYAEIRADARLAVDPELTIMYSVSLRTGTCYIRDIVLFLQDYCALQELPMKMNFTLAVAPPTYSVWKYGFFGEPTWRRQVAKINTAN